MWASYCNRRAFCGVVILCHEGWQRSSSQITLGLLVIIIIFSPIVYIVVTIQLIQCQDSQSRTFLRYNNATSSVLRVLLARNQTQKDALDRIKLSGVDEWIDAHVEIPNEQHSVQAIRNNLEFKMEMFKERANISRCPGDGK